MDENNIDAYSLLKNHIEAFSKIPDADWSLLVPHLSIKPFRKNQFLVREG